jgi:cytohesin
MDAAAKETQQTPAVPTVGALVARAVSPRATGEQRERAFAEIVRRFQDMAFGLAYAVLGDAALAEDAAQEAFLSAWRELDNLREPDAFPGWFRQIVRTQCSRLTRNKRLPTVSFEGSPAALFAAAPERDCDPLKRAERAEVTGAVHAALGALPEHERMATALYYIGGHDQAAIAAFLGVPVTTVKKRIHSARQRLRERMAPYVIPADDLTPGEAAVQDALRSRRPSRTEAFSDAVLLWRALDDNDAPAVATLLKKTKNGAASALLALREPGSGLPPLHVAARRGCPACVAALLDGGADPRAAAGDDGATPLHALAAGSARAEVAERLLAAGADVNARDAKGRTPLYVAARAATPTAGDAADHWGLCELLVAKGATVDPHSAAALDRDRDLGTVLTVRDPDEGGTPLHWAARAGWRKSLCALLTAGADVHAADARGHTPLRWAASPGRGAGPNRQAVKWLTEHGAKADIFTAALLGDTARVEALLAENPALANARDADGATPLMLASWSGARGVAEHLLERGGDVRAKDAAGRTAASCVSKTAPDAGLYELLLAAGAEPDLRAALALGREDLVRAALARDPAAAASPDLLEWAVDADLPSAKLLLLFESGAAREIVHAAALGLTDAVRAILDTDPDAVRHRNGGRNTALHRAAQRGHAEVVRLLLDQGAAVGAVADDGATPLHRAAAGGHVAVLRLLLDAGADPAARDHCGETPLALAAAHAGAEAVSLLAEGGAPVNAAGAGRQTPLHRAAERGDAAADTVRALLANGARTDARNYYGAAPLHVAARVDAPAVAALLLEAGADKLARDDWHRTPLHVAAWFDAAGVAAALLEAGVSVAELAYGFSTPLHTAAQNGSRRVAELLLARGADVNAATDFKRTPLHDAVQGGQYDLARLLLAHSADPNACNDRGMAPLHWAAASGKADVVRLLLEHGADQSLRSGKGKTAAEHAAGHGHAEVVRLLA